MTRKKTPGDLTYNRTIFRFLQKSYDEAFSLLVFSRDYFAVHGKTDKLLLPKDQQLIYTLTLSTITTQLTSVMSWLLLCKAVENGEISSQQMHEDDFSMPVFAPSLDCNDSCFAILTQTAQELLQKSHGLYTRVKRMEEPVREHLLETV
jgi:regulator of CtrA degradation